MRSMVFELIIDAILAGVSLFLLWEVQKLKLRLIVVETALNGVKPTMNEVANVLNEVRDMRETLDQLPIDDLLAQAEYEKSYADGLAAIAGYSYDKALGAGGERT